MLNINKHILTPRNITAANSRLPQWGLTWLNQVQCFYQSLCLVGSEVLQNPPLRQAAKRYQQGEADTQQKSCKLPTHRQSQKFATHLLLADPQKKNRMKMDYITYSERLDYLLDLIKNEKLFSPREVADKFDCSEKTVRNMINCLREKGFEIDYCKCSRKYFLKN